MRHYLFDALKISPVPLETANKVTEVGWMLEIEKILNNILEECNGNYEKAEMLIKDMINSLSDELKEEINKDSVLVAYSNKIKEMISEHIDHLIGDNLKYITFGLTDDGYFYAEVPDSLDGISFDTDLDSDSADYGKLEVIF